MSFAAKFSKSTLEVACLVLSRSHSQTILFNFICFMVCVKCVKHCRCNVGSNSCFLLYIEMAGRNDCAIVDALTALC